MAALTLNCNNQTLEWGKYPEEIYSGNINIDSIAFKFCELWNGYTKTAVFYHDKNEVYQVLLNDDNICLIPPEITEKNGLVYIGVFGIKGLCRRTTEVKKWCLGEGVTTEGMPSEPTPDIYQQILNKCAEAVKIAESVRSDADNGKFDGKNGDKGDPGYTPVKGVDYCTPTEKQELIDEITKTVTGDIETALGKIDDKTLTNVTDQGLINITSREFGGTPTPCYRTINQGQTITNFRAYFDDGTVGTNDDEYTKYEIILADDKGVSDDLGLTKPDDIPFSCDKDYVFAYAQFTRKSDGKHTDNVELIVGGNKIATTDYVGEQVGDIETALDTIIAIQRESVGD